MDFDWSLLGTVVGGGATALLTRFLGITQRMQRMENRLEIQAELIATQAQQIAGLTDENREQQKKMAKQDIVIRKQAVLIGDLTRANRKLAEAARRKEHDNAALAAEMKQLREDIQGGYSGLSIPPPPKLPTL